MYVYIISSLPQGKRVPLRSDRLTQGWGPLGVDMGGRDKKQNTWTPGWSTVYKRGGGKIMVFGDVHDMQEVLDEDDNQDCIDTGCYQVNKKIMDPD